MLDSHDLLEHNPTSNSDEIDKRNQMNMSELLNEMQVVHSMEARHAAQHGDLKLLLKLLDSGQATPDSVDSDDCSLLHWASINNRLEIAKFLIERQCNVNAIGGVLSSTPLHWAARHGHLQMISLLVRNGASWTLKDVEGFTPLHIAVQFGCTPVAAFLIAVGQSPDEFDDTRMTPAMWAAYKVYNVHPLKMLASMGADLEKCDGNYLNTALHWAVVQGNHTALNTLVKLNVNLEPLNRDKETPLDIARRKNDVLAVRILEMALRRKGILPLTWRQRLDEDKKIMQYILFCIPFLTTFLAGFIFNATMGYFSKLELLTLPGIFVSFSIRYFVKEHREISLQALFLGAAISSKLFFVLGWLVFLHPIVPFVMQILFLFLIVSVPFLFYRIVYSDAGLINVTHKDRCRMIIGMTEDECWNEKFCPTCLILKPRGTKHCRICNRCVLQFDHHCPWVNNCVGALNHKLFVAYLLLLNLSTLLTFFGCLIYWRDVCGQISHVNIVFCNPWVTQLHFYSFFFLFWTSMMSCIQGYEIIMAKTNSSKHQRCRSFHMGGSKLNARCPFSKRCLRQVCTLGCAPSLSDETDSDISGSKFSRLPSSKTYSKETLNV